MSKNRLYIQGQEVDLDDSISIPLNYSIADFKSPETRKRSVSKTIVLPSTQNNKNIFSSSYQLALTDNGNNLGFDFNPNVRVEARYIKNGREIFKGLCRLLEVKLLNGNYYFEVVLFSDFVNIIKQMGETLVSEMDWKEYNHDLDLSNITNSWNTSVKVNGADITNYTGVNPDGFGYWYPIIDYGYSASLFTYNLNDLVPLIYVKETFEKAFERLGYTIDSDFFDTDMFKALTWGFGGGKKEMLPPVDVANRRVEYDYSGVISRVGNSVQLTGNPTGLNWFFYNTGGMYNLNDLTDTVVTDLYSQYNSTTGKIVAQKSGAYNLNIDFDILIRGYFSTVLSDNDSNVRVEIYKNGSMISNTPYQNIVSGGTYNSFIFTDDFSLSLIAGDEVEVKLSVLTVGYIYSTTPFTYTVDVDFDNYAVTLTSLNGIFQEGDTINLSRFIPKMKTSDFVKGIIKMFNLYVSEPDDDGVIKIEPIQEYYDGEDNWTEILDHSKEISIKPASVNSAKFYNFKFTEDNDYYKNKYLKEYGSGYGDYVFESKNEFSTKEIDFIVPFAQTCPVKISSVSKLVIPRIVNIDDGTQKVTEYKGKARIYFNNGLRTANVSINDSTGLNSYTTYPQAHHSYGDINNMDFDLNFAKPFNHFYTFSYYKNNNIFSKYQKLTIEEQTAIDSKILRAYFKLTESDIDSEMFRRVVNINGVLYRKNVITDFDATGYETTRVELYKVLETTEIDIPNPEVIPTTPDTDSVPIIFSPSGVGVGVPVLNGGKNTGLAEIPIKSTLNLPTFEGTI